MVSTSAKVVMVSAIASGQGKTTTTAALARKLVKLGKTVRIFKTGPDFIDPMILERACGSPVYSLDLWMVGHAASQAMLAEAAQSADVILIEGVMGLYDGNPSSADLARAFGVPVLAVLDASAMAQTVGALALGLRDFGPVNLAGVIANRVASEGHAKMVAEAMRDIPLLGSLMRQEQVLPERHLGLVLPQEVSDIDTILDRMADQLSLNMDAWSALPETSFDSDVDSLVDAVESAKPLQGKKIAIARDAAFAFLYPANLRCLQDLGAELIYFSPIANEAIPVLTDALTDQNGQTWAMAGLLSGRVIMQQRLAALGGQEWSDSTKETTNTFALRGHTFHYSRFDTTLMPFSHASKQRDGAQGEALYQVGNTRASYFHAYFPSDPAMVARLFLAE